MTLDTGNRAIVIGGSLGGLLMMLAIGWQVDIYERSAHDLDSRGGGVVLQPDVVEAFQRAGIDTQALGVVAHERYYLNPAALLNRCRCAKCSLLGICCMALCGDIFPLSITRAAPAGE